MATIQVIISPSIPNVFVVVANTVASLCQSGYTDSNGVVTFTTLPAGNYNVYNVGSDDGNCPPLTCTFPPGYTGTRYPRRIDKVLTLNGNATVNFGYDNPIPFSSTNYGNPPSYAYTNNINPAGLLLSSGAVISIPVGPLNYINSNGMGYNIIDNMIYGDTGRNSLSGVNSLFYPYPYSFVNSGDCDTNGHYYNSAQAGSILCIDVNPYRTTYLRALNPYTGFKEELNSGGQISYTGPVNASADYSYIPNLNSLVGTDPPNLWILSLTTPVSKSFPTSGISSIVIGACYADISNFYYSNGSQLIKYSFTPTVANGVVVASTTATVGGDGCRAATVAVYYAQPNIVKSVDSMYATLDDIVTYTISIINNGIVPGLTSTFMDTLPAGTLFVSNSLTLNGVTQTGETPASFSFGSLPVGQLFTITFQAKVTTNTLPSVQNTGSINTTYFDNATSTIFSSTFQSNIVTTTLINLNVSSNKLVNKLFSIPGDTLIYTITIANSSSLPISNVIILDTTPTGTSFVSGTVNLNGVTVPSASLYPAGFNIGTLAQGAISTITFNVLVSQSPTVNVVSNLASINYSYLTGLTLTKTKNLSTNIVSTSITFANLNGINKYTPNFYATLGDTISYTITIPNTGNLPAVNVIFKDTIPNGTSLIPNSVTIDGIPQSPSSNPQTGITIGTIPAGSTSVVRFLVKVIS